MGNSAILTENQEMELRKKIEVHKAAIKINTSCCPGTYTKNGFQEFCTSSPYKAVQSMATWL